MNKKETKKVRPPKLTRGMSVSMGKFKKKIEKMSGVSRDLMGPANK